MKPQDLLFFGTLLFLFYKKSSKLSASFGTASLILSIPLFSLWIFFTAERLTWYAAAFFFLSVLQTMYIEIKNKK
jgi:hypothetical protein